MKQLENFFEKHNRWKPLKRYLERIRAFPDDGGIIVGNCKETLTGNEKVQNLVKTTCLKMGTLNQVAGLSKVFSSLALDEEHDPVKVAGYGPYNANEILYSVDLDAYRTELETYINEQETKKALGEHY